ncbi:MAG: 16S rRNA (uracil(1498)-N(3))-methyltransferase [Bacteroidales bacterium]|nr:16S rRNA (uracil(1498)-N(3))-methyltransferase [Bacteroidales bacterium]
MQVFYAPNIAGNYCVLDENESRHCVKVLRLGKSDIVSLIDGRGNLYEGEISEPNPKACVIIIRNVIYNYDSRQYKLHIAVSTLKNPERFDWLVEKCVEIGVDEITPVICNKTEKRSIRKERIESIIISAMKQSLKARLTVLNPVTDLGEFILQNWSGLKLIAHCSDEFERESILKLYKREKDVVFLIGPEGDFTGDEIHDAITKGFVSVTLGPSRLRSETAAIAACFSIYLLNQG